MLGFLRGGDQGGVTLFLFDHFLGLLDETFHSLASFAACRLVKRGKNLAQASDLVRSLALMLLERSAQPFVLRSLCHFRQRFQQLRLRIQQIL